MTAACMLDANCPARTHAGPSSNIDTVSGVTPAPMGSGCDSSEARGASLSSGVMQPRSLTVVGTPARVVSGAAGASPSGGVEWAQRLTVVGAPTRVVSGAGEPSASGGLAWARSLAVVAALLATVALGQPLDEREVVEAALERSPLVAASREATEAARAQATAARMARWPELAVSARYTRLSSLPERFRSLELDPGVPPLVLPQLLDTAFARATVSLPLSEALLRGAALDDAWASTVAASESGAELSRARLAFEARAALVSLQTACASREVAQQLGQAQAQVVADVASRVAVGASPAAHLAAVTSARETAMAQLEAERARVDEAAALLRAMLPASLAARVACDGVPPSNEAMRARLALVRPATDTEGPEASQVRHQAAAQKSRATAEALALVPSLSLVFGADLGAPHPRAFAVSTLQPMTTWDASVQLEWSFHRLLVGLSTVRQAEADARSLEALANDARHRQATALAVTSARLARQEDRLVALERRVVAAEAVVAARRDELRAGVGVALDVVTAEAELARARLEALSVAAEALVDLARLELLSGRL